jgi:NTP pyrophosphatase (non-canonical NTP hydrolase)
MNDPLQQTFDILQEECAEVIQVVSKIKRFGIDGSSNRERLESEIGDVLAMISILEDMKVINPENIESAKLKKFEKLKKWSTIYEGDKQ